MTRPRLRHVIFGTNVCILAVVLSLWGRSEYAFDAVYSVRYFRHVSPQWYFLQGIQAVDGQVIFVLANSTCLTVADASRGNSSEYDDLGMERTDNDEQPSTTISAWRTKRPTHYYFGERSLWNRLGFYNVWDLGYHNPTWSHRVLLPYWSIALPLSLWPTLTVAAYALRRTKRERATTRADNSHAGAQSSVIP